MNLEERCFLLEEENRQLRNTMRLPDVARYPAKWRLNGAESRVLSSLVSAPGGYRSREALAQAARRWETTAASDELLKVVMCTLRKKLTPFGIAIDTVHGEGYKLGEESKAKIVGARNLGGCAMSRLVTVTLQLPSTVWDAYRRAALHELTSPESVARQVLCEVCESVPQERMRELAEAEKAAREVA